MEGSFINDFCLTFFLIKKEQKIKTKISCELFD
jgi:hypothetical protein